jgi:hypothetical protein
MTRREERGERREERGERREERGERSEERGERRDSECGRDAYEKQWRDSYKIVRDTSRQSTPWGTLREA